LIFREAHDPLRSGSLGVKIIPCGPGHKEVYASMDWVDRYMKNMGVLCNIGLGDIGRVMDTVAPTGYKMVQDDAMIGSSM
jgi:hypothetical protein